MDNDGSGCGVSLHVIELKEVCSFERTEDTHDYSKAKEKGQTGDDDRRDAIELNVQ